MPPQRLGKKGERLLGSDFRLGMYDVICHRGKAAFKHNCHFRQLIVDHLELYSQCETKLDTSVLVVALVDIVRERSPSGGFVKICKKKKCYVEIGDRGARQKVAHALRNEMLDGSSKTTESGDDYEPSLLRDKPSKNQQQLSPPNLLDLLAIELKDSRTAPWSIRRSQIDSKDFGPTELDGNIFSNESKKKVSFKSAAEPHDDGCRQSSSSSTDSLSSSLLDSESLLLGLIESSWCRSTTDTLKDVDIDSIF